MKRKGKALAALLLSASLVSGVTAMPIAAKTKTAGAMSKASKPLGILEFANRYGHLSASLTSRLAGMDGYRGVLLNSQDVQTELNLLLSQNSQMPCEQAYAQACVLLDTYRDQLSAEQMAQLTRLIDSLQAQIAAMQIPAEPAVQPEAAASSEQAAAPSEPAVSQSGQPQENPDNGFEETSMKDDNSDAKENQAGDAFQPAGSANDSPKDKPQGAFEESSKDDSGQISDESDKEDGSFQETGSDQNETNDQDSDEKDEENNNPDDKDEPDDKDDEDKDLEDPDDENNNPDDKDDANKDPDDGDPSNNPLKPNRPEPSPEPGGSSDQPGDSFGSGADDDHPSLKPSRPSVITPQPSQKPSQNGSGSNMDSESLTPSRPGSEQTVLAGPASPSVTTPSSGSFTPSATRTITVKSISKRINRRITLGNLGTIDLLPDFTRKGAWKDSVSPYNTPSLWGQCTWFAWGRFYEMHGFSPRFSGNGYACVSQLLAAHGDKFVLSDKPAPGGIFSSDPAHNHVGVILEYDEENDLITIQEGNLDGVSNPNWAEAIEDYRTIRLSTSDLRALYGNVTFAVPKANVSFVTQPEKLAGRSGGMKIRVKSLHALSAPKIKEKVMRITMKSID